MQDFSLPATGGKTFHWQDARGKKLVVYFYPKDDTSGCTMESADFRDRYPEFERLCTEIVGISRDSLNSHEKFRTKLGLPFALLADTEEKVCQLFEVMKQKKLYGKDVRGIERSTFLFDESGQLINEWRGISASGHVENVLETLKSLTEK